MRIRTAVVIALATLAGPLAVAAQTAPAPAPAIDFSGVMFGNFQYRTDSAAKAQTGGKEPNKFDIERVYLTFRMPAGDRASIRISTDIFQNPATGYYAGWTLRLKYGYWQRELTKNAFGINGLTAVGRVGMLQTVVIDFIESHWPRSLGISDVERGGFFSSSDVGAAALFTLPNKRGEVYTTIMNGSGYTVGETDRFKDVGARVSLTPFANRAGMLKTFAVTPWWYTGATASQFFNGGAGQIGPVTDAIRRDRRGVFLSLKERKLTAGLGFSQRLEEVESGNNTVAVPRVVTDRTSNLMAMFALVRPREWVNKEKQSRLGVVARMDQLKVDKSVSALNQFTVLGVFFDVTPKLTLTANAQSLDAQSGSTTVPFKTLYVHWKVDY